MPGTRHNSLSPVDLKSLEGELEDLPKKFHVMFVPSG